MKINIAEIKQRQKPGRQNALQRMLSKEIHLFSSAKLSNSFFQKFYESLHDLLESGLDILTAFNIIKNQHKKKNKAAVTHIVEALSLGAFLSDAVKSCKGFNTYDTHLLKIGEKTGSLTEILKELENYYAAKIRLRRMLISALSYPILVMGVSIGVLYFMLGFLIPTFKDIYLRMDVELPAITQMMLKVSESFSKYSFVIPLTTLLIIALYILTRSNEAIKAKGQTLLLKTPLIGKILLQVQIMRFSHSMYLLLRSKIPITESLTLSARLSSFIPFAAEIEKFNRGIIQGNTFSSLIETSDLFDAQYAAMIRVGEQTGILSKVFEKLFEQKMTQMNHLTKMIGDLLEPILIVVIGGLVALVLIAMYLPMFSLSF
jgi:type IV pilus assembly protein PilC